MTDTPPDVTTYAAPADVLLVLGKLGASVAATPDLDVDTFVRMAHATIRDRLTDTYAPGEIPTFTGEGADVVRWAEARLAAADLLDILHAAKGTDSAVAENLRATALDTLTRGVPGYANGGSTGTPTGAPARATPRSSTRALVTVFRDPYTLIGNVRPRPVNRPEYYPTVPVGLVPVPITQADYDDLVAAGADDPRYLYVIVEPGDPALTPGA